MPPCSKQRRSVAGLEDGGGLDAVDVEHPFRDQPASIHARATDALTAGSSALSGVPARAVGPLMVQYTVTSRFSARPRRG
jgi:hypothetical protein